MKGGKSMSEGITTALDTAFKAVQTNTLSVITTSLPYALGIVGTVLAISISVKVFKKITGR